jgi:ParB-like nuclease family protein
MAGGRSTRAKAAKRPSDAPPKASGHPALAVEQWLISKLLRYPNNAREHSDAQVAQIAKSVKEFGFVNPVLVDANGVLIAGHGRTEAAQSIGLKTVPVIQLGHLTEAQAKALRLADNQLALNSSWNAELLAIELKDLKLANYDLQLLGFEQHTLDWFTGDGSLVDASGQWTGMPEFTQEDKTAFRTVKIHFTCQEDVDAFARLLNQKVTENTKFLWFPPIEAESRMTTTYVQQAAE